MSKLANKSMIGAFVVGAIVLAVVAVVVFGSGKFLKKQQSYIMYFQGSVKGLAIGSPVMFRGVRIGDVRDISIKVQQEDLSFYIPVIIDIDMEKVNTSGIRLKRAYEHFQTLIQKGLRAQLQSQSFVTGQLGVALDFFPDKPAKFVGLNKKYHEIPTVPTTLEDIQKALADLNLKEVVERVKSSLEGIDKMVNSPEIGKTLAALSQTAEEARTLVRNVNSHVGPVSVQAVDTLKDIQKLVQNVNTQVGPLLSTVQGTVTDVQKLVQHVDTRIDPVLANADGALQSIQSVVQNDVRKLVQDVNGLVPEVTKTLTAMQGTLQEAQVTLGSIGGASGANSPLFYELAETLEEVSHTAQSLRTLTDYIQQHPEALLKGKKNP